MVSVPYLIKTKIGAMSALQDPRTKVVLPRTSGGGDLPLVKMALFDPL